MKKIKTEDAVGKVLSHDIARIVIGEKKDTPFRRGHVVSAEDISELLSLGKEHLFVLEEEDFDKMHEEEVASALYDLCDNEYIYGTEVREGKIEAISEIDGLFKVDVLRLKEINSIGELTIVTKKTNTPVKAGDKLAGMRCIPLLLDSSQVEMAKVIGGGKPLFEMLPFVCKSYGVVTTGTEVFSGRIQDAFTPIIQERAAAYGMKMLMHHIVPDDKGAIEGAIQDCLDKGADMVFCTGGMSVDPDDLTPGAIKAVAKEVVTYGLPVLPGSMFCIAYAEDGRAIIGVPGGVLFSSPTAFDMLLPRFVAKDKMTKEDCIELGHGGFLG